MEWRYRIVRRRGVRVMKALQSIAILWILSVSTPLFAGLRYHFESSAGGRVVMSGHVSVEGKKSRIEIDRGDRLLFRDGAVVLNGPGSTLYVLDSKSRQYSVLDPSEMLTALKSLLGDSSLVDIRATNPRFTVRNLGGAGKIERFDVQKFAVDSSCDLTVSVGGAATRVRLRSASQIWTTPQLSRDYASFIQEREMKTGIAELDALLEKQSASVTGFPLRQVVSTTIEVNDRVTRVTSLVTIDHVEQKAMPATLFELPKGYKRVERGLRMR